jgi:cellulose synthase/poly-beta-1,6-N-acetylglucosamine synthase-like glycosyltransferase
MAIFDAPHMSTLLLLLFICCVFLVFYTYLGFPIILRLLASNKKVEIKAVNELPEIAICMSVYNEEKVIAEKLDCILKLDYPKNKISLIIGSDGSGDRTDEIISDFKIKAGSQFRNIIFIRKSREGKPSMLNELVGLSTSEIVVLTDANVMMEKNVLQNLVRHFGNERTGLVGANILNTGMKKEDISVQEKSYIERENLIKFREGLVWGTMMGPFGGCYAMRRNLFMPVPKNFLVDDFYISMNVLAKNYKCINDIDAICYEDIPGDIMEEYRRKARISAGNFQNLMVFKKFLFRPLSAAGFCFISHKVLRWITPFLIIISLIALYFLSANNKFFTFLFLGELLLVLSPVFDFIFSKAGIHLRVLRFIAYFSLMNLAMLKGFVKFLGGIRTGIWESTVRK